MPKSRIHGATTPLMAEGKKPPTSSVVMDECLETLERNKKRWAQDISIAKKIAMLERLKQKVSDYAEQWIRKDIENRGRKSKSWDTITSVVAGPALILRLVKQYIRTLKDLQKYKQPKSFGKVHENLFEHLVIEVFPLSLYDKFIFRNHLAEIWFKPGVSLVQAIQKAHRLYCDSNFSGKVGLVLGAGNYASIVISDLLKKLFNDKEVVIVKIHPIIEYLGEIIKKIFSEFIEAGFLRIVYGGPLEGAYLCEHPKIESIHLTGSDKRFEDIVFGRGLEKKINKLKIKSRLNKTITAELGNVSPVIIVPGQWSRSDLNYQAENIVSSFAFNSGFTCNASRLIIQQRNWNQRWQLIEAIKKILQKILNDDIAYYPGAIQRLKRIRQAYPEIFQVGNFKQGCIPWLFAYDIDSDLENELCFKSEIFGSFIGETSIGTDSIVDYLKKAVDFCNNKLWGNLNAMIIVQHESMSDMKINSAVNRAIRDLHYGTIAVNVWPGLSYYLGTTGWGAYPYNSLGNIQSGFGMIHNTFMFEHIEKSVLKAPFRIWPKPVFPTNKNIHEIGAKILKYEKKSNLKNVLQLFFASVKG